MTMKIPKEFEGVYNSRLNESNNILKNFLQKLNTKSGIRPTEADVAELRKNITD